MADEPNIEETPVAETADEAVAPDAAPVAEKPKRASRAKAAPKADEPVAEAEAPAAEPEAEPVAEAAVEAPAEAEVEAAAETEAPAEPEAAPAAKAAPKSKAKAAAKTEDAADEPKRRGPRPKPLKKAAEVKKERGVYRRDPKVIGVQAPRKERRGVVVSSKPDKTIIIRVDSAKPHPKYLKIVRRSIKLHAHDERNEANTGDVVKITETRPLSKLKRWRLTEILERAK
jgi:small subunit ribosomal protein S17